MKHSLKNCTSVQNGLKMSLHVPTKKESLKIKELSIKTV